MHVIIDVDNFKREIKKSDKPVLMACFQRNYNYKAQKKILDALSKKYRGSLKICILNEDYRKAIKHINIEGVPTYIIFIKGIERGRMLGKVDNKRLVAFIERAFNGSLK